MKVWSKEVFAKNLRRYAERSDKSQKEIAEVVHVSTATVSDWFNAKKFPRIDKIEALADYFGILKSDLIEDKTEEREKMQKNNDVMTDIVLRLRTDNEYLSVCVLLKDFNKEQLQDAVKDYQIQMHYFEDITPDEISEMFFRLNNGKAMSAIELTRCKAQSMDVIKEIGEHELFKNALTEKALARYTNEDIVVKSYVLLHEEEPSLETKFIRPYMESVEFTDEDKDQLCQIYTRILNVHGLIEEKKIAKRLLTRTHMISIVPVVWKSITDGHSEQEFAEWFCKFFAGTKSASVDDDYNDCAGSGSAKSTSVKKRLNAIDRHWRAFCNVRSVIVTDAEQMELDEAV